MKTISTKCMQITKTYCNISQIQTSLIEDAEIKIHINDYLFISFICIKDNLEFLAIGYLINIGVNANQIKTIKIKENDVFVQCDISKENFFYLINRVDIIPTCQSIYLNNKNNSSKIQIPFNSAKVNLNPEKLSKIIESIDLENNIFKAYLAYEKRILFSSDINAKNAIYKVFGSIFKINNEPNMGVESRIESILIINFPLSIEILKQILMYKITFIVFIDSPSFTTVKYAQKYGLTIIEMKSYKEFKIYTHHSRIKN